MATHDATRSKRSTLLCAALRRGGCDVRRLADRRPPLRGMRSRGDVLQTPMSPERRVGHARVHRRSD